MSQQKRTIMGACDYSIAAMQNLKKDLQDLGAPNGELNWAIGGIVVLVTSNLLKICDQVIQEAFADKPNANQVMIEIKERFGQFIDRTVNHE